MLLADMGLPMIGVVWPLGVVAFIPIVAIETEVMRRRMGVTFKEAVGAIVAANVLTTVIGIPLTWALVAFLQFEVPGRGGAHFAHSPPIVQATIGSAWLPSDGPGGPVWWVFPVANLVLLLPLWAGSSFLEAFANRSSFGKTSAVTRATWLANLASYGLLAAFWLVILLVGSLHQHPVNAWQEAHGAPSQTVPMR